MSAKATYLLLALGWVLATNAGVALMIYGIVAGSYSAALAGVGLFLAGDLFERMNRDGAP
jgi:hypothetical protein